MRRRNGKEDRNRWREKIGEYQQSRLEEIAKAKEGKSVMWFHAASVGEVNAIKPLLKALDHPSRLLLITTGTRSSALVCMTYKDMYKNVIHAFGPLDTPQTIKKFLKIWEPQIMVLIESEIWPNMIEMTSKKCPVAIINGRMSEKSFNRWRKLSFFLRRVLSNFSFITTSDEISMRYYSAFYNKNIYCTGNLKYDAAPLAADEKVVKSLKSSIGDKPVIVCASTHYGEEELLLKAYNRIIEQIPDLLMIIVPRHVERGEDIKALCEARDMNCILRSQDEDKNHIDSNAQIYIADTLGELGVFYRLSDIAFVGGSLINIGGHNVIEAMLLGCSVIIGPHYQNFSDTISGLNERNAIIITKDYIELASTFVNLYQDADKRKNIQENANAFINENKGAIDRTIGLLSKYM